MYDMQSHIRGALIRIIMEGNIVIDKIPKQMNALVLTEPGKFELQEVPVPEVAEGEILCKIRAVAICGSDPEIIRGDLAGIWPPAYPFTPGHEWAGEVVAVGKGVYDFAPGDRVAGQAHKGCGVCRKCLEGRYNICENYGRPETGHRHYGFISRGAFAQYNSYSVKSVNRLPNSISFREGALIDTSGVVVHGMRQAGITIGGTVVIIGPGPIGLIAMRMAKVLGAAKVIVVGRNRRLQLAAKLGADIIIDFEKEDPVKAIRSATEDLGVDEAFECSGASGTFRQAVQSVKRGGRVGLLGVPEGHVDEALPFGYVVSNEIAIFGSKANPNVSDKVISLVASGKLGLKDLISHVYPLNEFSEALEAFIERRDGALKVVIEPNGPEAPAISHSLEAV